MDAIPTPNASVERFDRVSLDGRCGTAVAFWAKEERTVLVRFDSGVLLEVPECQLVVEAPHPGARDRPV